MLNLFNISACYISDTFLLGQIVQKYMISNELNHFNTNQRRFLALWSSGSEITHFRALVSITAAVTRLAPMIDQTSGNSRNMIIWNRKANATSADDRVTDTIPASSTWSAIVSRSWP